MRINEIITEGRDLRSTALDLLVAAKANDIFDIDTDVLLDQLNAMGFNLSMESLLEVLDGLDIIDRATEKETKLRGFISPIDPDKKESDQERVKQLATKLAKKRIEQ